MVYRPKSGLLLMNLGTPERPQTGPVRRYLREFLTDWRVLDIPAWKRRLVVELLILPKRPKESAEAYAAIWSRERGSPLMFHCLDLVGKVQALVGPDVPVELAMRYGQPDADRALDRLAARGADRIVAFPLYPQYSSSATGSAIEALLRAAAARWNAPFLQVVPPFFDHPAFIEAFRQVAQPVLEDVGAERVLFSFHGLPERQILKSDASGGQHCLQSPSCCERISQANRNCYRAHCYATARALGDALGIAEAERMVCFQSRLGKDPWIRPYTDEVVREVARAGVKRAAILSPAFTADCLETLEELGIRAAEDFEANGGEELRLVPSLNATDTWARAVVDIARQTAPYLPAPDGGTAGSIREPQEVR